jgi:hypothetical protein
MATDTTTLTQPTGDHRTITGFIKEGKLVGMVALDSPTALIRMSPELLKQNTVARPERQQQTQQQPAPAPAAAPQQVQPEPEAVPQELEQEPVMAEAAAYLPRRSSPPPSVRARPHPRLLVRSGGGGGRSNPRPPR